MERVPLAEHLVVTFWKTAVIRTKNLARLVSCLHQEATQVCSFTQRQSMMIILIQIRHIGRHIAAAVLLEIRIPGIL